MLVSVIVPTRNRPHVLATALAAIARQGHLELEIVVVDDGSSTESAQANRAILEATGRESVYVRLGDRELDGSGPSLARNAGIKAAMGELIAFCDDDDEWCDDGHLEAAAAIFAQNSSADIVFGNQQTRASGSLQSKTWLPLLAKELNLPDESDASIHVLTKEQCLIDHFPSMNLCVFRATLLRDIGGFWEAIRYSEDMDLYVRAVEGARQVLYRNATVCIHHVADSLLRASASTRLDSDQKDLALAMIAHHLLLTTRSEAARLYARRVGGFACRRLARSAQTRGNRGAAVAFARQALSLWPTGRWLVFSAWISCRSLFESRRL
ncbi:MAG: glycosyltransferase family A protein [Burkholderiaceae bacterium]|jgi:glycosyltransferase involved in cell wall biosynthesis